MDSCFDVDGLTLEELLREWRWLVEGDCCLLAINPFGDLFLRTTDGQVACLDITAGKLSLIARSESEFRKMVRETSRKNEWFLTDDARKAGEKGLVPDKGQCIGAKIPWVFLESAGVPDNLRVVDLYEYVSFIGRHPPSTAGRA
jgi:hypothetical protein